MTMTNTALNNAQLELLKLFSKPMSDKELKALKKTLLIFLSNKIDEDVDKIWKTKKFNQTKLDKVLNTHIKRKK